MDFTITISLDDWEKKLLDDFAGVFNGSYLSRVDTGQDLSEIKKGWFWYRKLRNDVEEIVTDPYQREGHRDNPPIVWERIQQRLKERSLGFEGVCSCHSRLSNLLNDNRSLPGRFRSSQMPEIDMENFIVFNHADEPYWKLVGGLMNLIPPSLRGIWEGELILPRIGIHSTETVPFMPDLSPEDGESTNSTTNGSRGAFLYKEFEIWGLVRKAVLFCRLISATTGADDETGRFSVTTEEQCLKFIPLDELECDGDIVSGSIVRWRPEKAVLLEHHLFTEEEIFKYCVENDFVFPGYCEQNTVVFIAGEMKTWSGSLGSASNDCAITRDQGQKKWYILETRPGIKFRALIKDLGFDLACAYFRRIVNEKLLGPRVSLQDVICDSNLQARWDYYDQLVDVIDFSEIRQSDKQRFEGANGVVLKAQWDCPRKVNMSRSETYDVALKTIKESVGRSRARLLHELEVTFAILSQKPRSSINLLGVTKTSPDGILNDQGLREFQDTIFLVFEWSESSLETYLSEELNGTTRDWDVIANIFRDLVDSLLMISKDGNVHRDIHMGNICVRQRVNPNDPHFLTEPEIVIIDMDYHAPEVARGHKYSHASDVYAIGYLMKEILRLRKEQTFHHDDLIPKPFSDIIQKCLKETPEARPTVEELSDDFQATIDAHYQSGEGRPGQVFFEEKDCISFREAMGGIEPNVEDSCSDYLSD